MTGAGGGDGGRRGGAPPPEPTYSIVQQIACVKREIALRKNVPHLEMSARIWSQPTLFDFEKDACDYPKWVQSGRMKPEAAEREIACMIAVLRSLEEIQGGKDGVRQERRLMASDG